MRLHLSWLSDDSRFHASAIDCAGETAGLGGRKGFRLLCGDGESEAICAQIEPYVLERAEDAQLKEGVQQSKEFRR